MDFFHESAGIFFNDVFDELAREIRN